ncbi:MAG: MazG nucleotide pyrophosphohydrolase domain-containing protein [Candidatus Omnitrophota bacterium]
MDRFKELQEIVRILRSKKGCQWDRAQKVSDMTGYLLEEVYELIDAISLKKPRRIKEEIGDVVLIIVFIAQIYEEKKVFNISDALAGINDKLLLRHPHVFTSSPAKNRRQIVSHWARAKAKTKRRRTLYDRLPKTAPSLLLASILFKEYLAFGRKIDYRRVIGGIKKELSALSPQEISGDKISKIIIDLVRFSAANGIDLENTLRRIVFAEAKKAKYSKICLDKK